MLDILKLYSWEFWLSVFIFITFLIIVTRNELMKSNSVSEDDKKKGGMGWAEIGYIFMCLFIGLLIRNGLILIGILGLPVILAKLISSKIYIHLIIIVFFSFSAWWLFFNKTTGLRVWFKSQPKEIVQNTIPVPDSDTTDISQKPIPSNFFRYALLIGNQSYKPYKENSNHAAPLKNPRADAQDMAKVLNGYGFKTTMLTDADRGAMENGVQAFVRQLTPGSIALFYYSGHGVQINDKKEGESRNYLLPVKQNFVTAAQVKHNAVSANWVLEELQASPAQVKLMILDACREKMTLEADAKNLGSTGGFGAMGASGVLIAYASARGALAYGDSNARNSVFTGHLLNAMRNGGNWLIEKVLREANTAVVQSMGNKQEPWTEGNLIGGDFCLGGCQ